LVWRSRGRRGHGGKQRRREYSESGHFSLPF